MTDTWQTDGRPAGPVPPRGRGSATVPPSASPTRPGEPEPKHAANRTYRSWAAQRPSSENIPDGPTEPLGGGSLDIMQDPEEADTARLTGSQRPASGEAPAGARTGAPHWTALDSAAPAGTASGWIAPDVAAHEPVRRERTPDDHARPGRVTPPPYRRGRDTSRMSTADLVRLATDQLSRLVRDEIRLAQAEMREKGRHAGAGIGLVGAAGVVALYAIAAVITAVVLALALVMPNWLAALVVGVVLFAIAGGMVLFGRGQLRQVGSPYPERAVRSAKTDAHLLRERAGR